MIDLTSAEKVVSKMLGILNDYCTPEDVWRVVSMSNLLVDPDADGNLAVATHTKVGGEAKNAPIIHYIYIYTPIYYYFLDDMKAIEERLIFWEEEHNKDPEE